jgi:hypothetical protein
MKAVLKRIAAEWEKGLLWVSVLLLAAVVVVQLTGLLREAEGEPVKSKPAQMDRSLLNEATAYAFLQPAPPPADLHNPFAFSCKMPAQAQAAAPPTERRAWKRQKPPTPPPPAVVQGPAPPSAPAPAPAPPPPAPPAPKRSVGIVYRGVYKGGEETGRQLAFLSSQPGGSGSAAMAVAGVGQAVAGVTVKSFTPEALTVTAPTGEEVTISLGQQKKILLE